ncbi:MAG TPA: glycosyl hydrolase 115 family protein, partial [Niabella sp.]|nr:glycosyl hydrolase 115 family protein [Niabella sp.]
WVIGFRGNGDHPFWYTFKDAPASMKQRGEIINTMMQQQREIVKQVARDTALEFRTIFYDELSDLLARGFIEPPADTNFIWTYVAARRDHYPNEDVQQLDKNKNYRLGYYFNYQFTSTGSHLAAGEGPWKMEKNYRFIAGKTNRPLAFSVVNAGNLREFLMELSANAVMMWDMKSFSSDAFLLKYSEQYFGRKQAREVAKLYKTYYDAYWQQRKPDLEGFDRQYIFQDLRYKRAIAELAENFLKLPRNQNPLTDIAAEQLKGRTYRLIPQDNHASDQVSAIIYGTTASAKKFLQVKNKAEAMVLKIPVAQRTFFKDNLLQPANYMYYLNESLLQLANGYQESNQQQKKRYVTKARKALQQAQQALQSTATGNFRDWYQGDRVFGFKEVFKLLDRISAK